MSEAKTDTEFDRWNAAERFAYDGFRTRDQVAADNKEALRKIADSDNIARMAKQVDSIYRGLIVAIVIALAVMIERYCRGI